MTTNKAILAFVVALTTWFFAPFHAQELDLGDGTGTATFGGIHPDTGVFAIEEETIGAALSDSEREHKTTTLVAMVACSPTRRSPVAAKKRSLSAATTTLTAPCRSAMPSSVCPFSF